MTQAELEARRDALRSEIARTRAAIGVQSSRLREEFKWMLIASAAMRLVPKRFRWVGVVAAVVGVIGKMRARGAD